MLLGETLNANDVKLSESERIALGLEPRAALMSDVVENATLKNKTRFFLKKLMLGVV